MHATRGHTLIELLATLAVVAVLAAVATPAFRALGADLRRAAALAGLLATLDAARRQAAAAGVPVALCPLDDAGRCARRGARYGLPAGGPVQALAAGQWLELNRDALLLSAGGLAATPVTWRLCDRLAPAEGRAVIVSRSGRARVSRLDASGRPVDCAA